MTWKEIELKGEESWKKVQMGGVGDKVRCFDWLCSVYWDDNDLGVGTLHAE